MRHVAYMFLLNCHHCGESYLVGSQALQSLHNTSDGPVAYLKCPQGHNVIVAFPNEQRDVLPTADRAAAA